MRSLARDLFFSIAQIRPPRALLETVDGPHESVDGLQHSFLATTGRRDCGAFLNR